MSKSKKKDASSKWVYNLRSRFIVFDGPDGSGKSTQFRRLSEFVHDNGIETCEVREPGGSSIGEKIREILLDPANDEMVLRCEMLLYMASRAQLAEECIKPSMMDGQLILVDRFISSTLAYQGAAGGLDPSDIMAVGEFALQDVWPDLTVIFDVDELTAQHRLVGKSKRKKHLETTQMSLFSDRMELKGADYHRNVRQGFLDQAEANPDKYLVIDATKKEEVVWKNFITQLKKRVETW
ncbi:Thymidylate kinase [Poriferisphaera corsica]|uniref:Thymidylate kinase n=1 Tax=Poriferisphaera corsica TaxID=2528020 RepID=A0A517YWN2_9BACT|nr:dTMP kinase [Poriferisphaera corsica]QDU34607.1 Thymidylate kinase [Poriferisphaera corsica]